MNLFDYYFKHAIPTGWRRIHGAFRVWGDLISGNCQGYALFDYDDPEEECREWFWLYLEDDVYPKSFLEDLEAIVAKLDQCDEYDASFAIQALLED